MAFRALEKYSSNLLKDESERHHAWRRVNFNSGAFQQHVRHLKGNMKILNMIGYCVELYHENGDKVAVSFAENETPNELVVTQIATDLCIAKVELEEILSGNHPQIKEFIDLDIIPQGILAACNTATHSKTIDSNKIDRQQHPQLRHEQDKEQAFPTFPKDQQRISSDSNEQLTEQLIATSPIQQKNIADLPMNNSFPAPYPDNMGIHSPSSPQNHHLPNLSQPAGMKPIPLGKSVEKVL